MKAYVITYPSDPTTINTTLVRAESEQDAVELICKEHDLMPSDIHRVELYARCPG